MCMLRACTGILSAACAHLPNLCHDKPSALQVLAMLEHALNHTAAKGVSGQWNDACEEVVNDVDDEMGRHCLDDFLYNVIGVLQPKKETKERAV